jgi:two-component system phosphate regulon response regulator PhoB
MARSSGFDLIILEIRLPDRNGLELCRILQTDGYYPPVVVLTQNSARADAILALNLGADAFMSKETDSLYLVAQIEALLRRRHMARASAPQMPRIITAGPLTLDVENRRFRLYSRAGVLSQTEARLLAALASAPDRIFSRDELIERVWGPEYQGSPNMLNTLVKRLRRRLTPDEKDPQYIVNIPARGYVLSLDCSAAQRAASGDAAHAAVMK